MKRTFLSPEEIQSLSPQAEPERNARHSARERLQAAGQWSAGQMAGRRWAVACVSLEVTQRCNLDCTLCYLSDNAEAVQDLPLEEIFRRIDQIHAHYGPDTDVQVSGGEPTLRSQEELLAIVQRIRARGMRSSLFTNGIRASRALLQALAQAGMTDVAFHVDTTQQRRGYDSEEQLHALRREYIERARGTGLNVLFNTTLHRGNWHTLAALATFFVRQADVVRFCSFQLQAETGRGVQGPRADAMTLDAAWQQIQSAVDTPLHVNVLAAGHSDCNRSAVVLVANTKAVDAFPLPALAQQLMQATSSGRIERGSRLRALWSLCQPLVRKPRLLLGLCRWVVLLARALGRDAVAARGQVHKLTFFTHNFMDARALQHDRLQTCVFMAMTAQGPMSMCAYNARREDFLSRPIPTAHGLWHPLRTPAATQGVPVKWLKGRQRAQWLASRRAPQGWLPLDPQEGDL
jgi:7,8-dihydro-6-hydroxymethylpterin dimethyltransferase